MNDQSLTAKAKVLHVLDERGPIALRSLAHAIPDTKAETIRRVIGQELIRDDLVRRLRMGVYQITPKGRQFAQAVMHPTPQGLPHGAATRDEIPTKKTPYLLMIRGPTNYQTRVSKQFVHDIMAKLMNELEDE